MKLVQDGEGLQQLHVQKVLPPCLCGQLEEGLDRAEEDRGGEEEAGRAENPI